MTTIDLTTTVTEKMLDENHHMNHVAYVYTFEQGRKALYEAIGLSDDVLEKTNRGTVVVKLDVDFKKEVLRGDTLQVATTIRRIGTKSYTIFQQMMREDDVVAEATVISVVIDRDKRKAIHVPKEITDNFE